MPSINERIKRARPTFRQRKIGKRPVGETELQTHRRIFGEKTATELEEERALKRRRRKLQRIRAQKAIDKELGF